MSEYRQARLLKYNRVCKKITQENLSEGICDPVTLARYEAGRLEPSNENYYRLMSKMGLNGDRYYISSGNELYEKYELKNKIKMYENIINEYKEKIKDQNVKIIKKSEN